ncbi:transposase [Zunongwangia sp. H14]|uniref:transposase n=1 Tax=Zunongwangia sp. H14 TaxID=3240792 RepID=UPI003567D28B
MQLILNVSNYSSSTWYEKPRDNKGGKPGPKPAIDDAQALQLIKDDLENSKFNGGYLKVKKRLARTNKHIAKHRVNALMREHDLLSPNRPVKNGRKRTHNGKIITDKPDIMWGTDGKKFWAGKDGWCWLFSVIDHFNDEIISWHPARTGNRFEALAPVQRAVKLRFGSLNKAICAGTSLQLRSDHGTQYESRDFLNEMNFLGLELSKSFVRSPECNGVIERFHRTLNEQVFDINCFESFEEEKKAIDIFMTDYTSNGCYTGLTVLLLWRPGNTIINQFRMHNPLKADRRSVSKRTLFF